MRLSMSDDHALRGSDRVLLVEDDWELAELLMTALADKGVPWSITPRTGTEGCIWG